MYTRYLPKTGILILQYRKYSYAGDHILYVTLSIPLLFFKTPFLLAELQCYIICVENLQVPLPAERLQEVFLLLVKDTINKNQ
jgi:hypothetical protein